MRIIALLNRGEKRVHINMKHYAFLLHIDMGVQKGVGEKRQGFPV
jgi:hypothetical protein